MEEQHTLLSKIVDGDLRTLAIWALPPDRVLSNLPLRMKIEVLSRLVLSNLHRFNTGTAEPEVRWEQLRDEVLAADWFREIVAADAASTPAGGLSTDLNFVAEAANYNCDVAERLLVFLDTPAGEGAPSTPAGPPDPV